MYACKELESLDAADKDLGSAYRELKPNMTSEVIFNRNCDVYNYTKQCSDLIKSLEKTYSMMGNQEEVDKQSMLKDMLSVLEPYISDTMSVLDTPIKEIYDRLSQEYRSVSIRINVYSHFVDVINHINNSISYAKKADKDFQNLGVKPDLLSEESQIGISLDDHLSSIQSEINQLLESSREYKINENNYSEYLAVLKNNSYLTEYINQPIVDVENKAKDLDKELSKIETQLNSLNSQISILNDKIKLAESMDSHPLYEYKQELNCLRDSLEEILSDFNSKDKILQSISSNVKVEETGENKQFLEQKVLFLEGDKIKINPKFYGASNLVIERLI